MWKLTTDRTEGVHEIQIRSSDRGFNVLDGEAE